MWLAVLTLTCLAAVTAVAEVSGRWRSLLEMTSLLCLLWIGWDLIRRRFRLPYNKCVLITGCDSGFGRLAALKLDELSVMVFAGCLTEDGARSLSAAASRRLTTVIMDITDTASIQRCYDTITSQLPEEGLWGLVNNVGVLGAGGPIRLHQKDEFELTFKVNVLGMTEVTRIFLPLLMKSGGRVVNTSSSTARAAMPDWCAYATSKFAVEGYSDCLRREMSRYGIRVSIIEPGGVRTSILNMDAYDIAKRKQWQAAPQDVKEEYGNDYLKLDRDMLVYMWGFLSENMQPVVAAYEHALFAVYPRQRYLVGIDAHILAFLNIFSPLTDWIISKAFTRIPPKIFRK